MNRHHYSQKAISTFEIIGSYFVDVFYNYLYLNADKNHRYSSEGRTTLTEEYISSVKAYIVGVSENAKYYQKTVIGVLEQYRTHTKYNTITLTEFINRTLEQFLPEEHFSILTDADKEFFFNKIITNTVNGFAKKVLRKEMLEMIIDDHMNENNTRSWLDQIVDIQILERESLFNHFLKQTMRANGRSREQVDIEIVEKIREDRDKLWHQVQELLAIKCKLESELQRAQQVSEVLYKKMTGGSEASPKPTSVGQHRMEHVGQHRMEHVGQHRMEHVGQHRMEHVGQHRMEHVGQHREEYPMQHRAQTSLLRHQSETQAPPKTNFDETPKETPVQDPSDIAKEDSGDNKEDSEKDDIEEAPPEPKRGVRRISYSLDEQTNPKEPIMEPPSMDLDDEILVDPEAEVSDDIDVDYTFLEGTSKSRKKDN